MKMYKFLGLMAVAGLTLTACNDDDDNTAEVTPDQGNEQGQPEQEEPYDPPHATQTSSYTYILGTGNEGYAINGEVGVLYFPTCNLANMSFAATNGRSLGMTPNDMAVHGRTGVIAVTTSNTIEVVNLPSLKSLKQIELTGQAYGKPRCVTYADGHYFISMQTGHVVRLNASTWEIDGVATIPALDGASGVNPEGMAVADGKLYVAMADYNSSDAAKEDRVVVINIDDMTIERSLNVAVNLTDIIYTDGKLYALSSGDYDAYWNPIGAGIYAFDTNGTSQFVVTASYTAPSTDGKLYYISAIYNAPTTTLGYINTATNEVCKIAEPAPGASPTALGIAPDGKSLLIGSNSMGESGWAAYDIPGYLVRYELATGQSTEIETNITGINRIITARP